jgi:hypothetical protein
MDRQTTWTADIDPLPKSPINDPGISSESEWESLHLADDPRWQLAKRISTSASFARSALLSKFLLYVCDRALNGKTGEISEHQIGVHVFGRRPGYSPGEDNIVRNYARQLRQRLDHYFNEEGSHEELRISIPRGKYVPVFSPNNPSASISVGNAPASDEEESAEPAPLPDIHSGARAQTIASHAATPRKHYWIFLVVALLLCIIGGLLWILRPRSVQAPTDSSHPLWAQLFDKSHQTLLVPADDGIVMIQNLTNHSVNLSEYISRDYLSVKSPYKIDAANMADLDAQRYTSVADLDTVLKFSHLPEASPEHVTVRYARELHMEDLKDANAILLGSSFSNPWVELFQKNLNFEFGYQPHPNQSVITNRHPASGELPVYANDATGPSHRTYAVIALVPNLNDTGWVLIIEGLTMAGTQAASDILFNRDAMHPILERAQAANGQLKPFEVLIETRSFGSNSPQASIIASRVYSKPAA